MADRLWGKNRTLELYTNVVEFSPGSRGIDAAALKYYQKNAKNLTNEEAAQIVACLPNPQLYNPGSKDSAFLSRVRQIGLIMIDVAKDPRNKNIFE